MFTKQFCLGRKGQILHPGVQELTEEALDEFLNPADFCLQFSPKDTLISYMPCFSNDQEMIDAYVANNYERWGKFGPHGDFISITSEALPGGRMKTQITQIFNRGYRTTTQAADILPFIIDSRGEVFFIGIIRKYNPGQGKAAFVGGLTDFHGMLGEIPIDTAIREAREEVKGLSIKRSLNYKELYQPIMLDHESVDVSLGSRHKIASKMRYVGTFQTSDQENLDHLGRKRVDETTAYLLPITIFERIEKSDIESWLMAGDDAARVEVFQVTAGEVPEFGIKHHAAIYMQAWAMLKKNYLRSSVRATGSNHY